MGFQPLPARIENPCYSLEMSDEIIVSAPKGAGVVTYPPGATFGPRVLTDYEFVWLLAGHAEYEIRTSSGATKHDLPPHSILLCRPGVTDAFRWDPKQPTRHAFVHFDVEHLPAHLPRPATWPYVRALPAAESDVLRPVFRHLLTWYGKSIDPYLQQLSLRHLLAAFVSGVIETHEAPRDRLPEPVERAMTLIYQRLDADPAAPILLADLVDAACVTANHLCRVFKKSTGRSPIETVWLAKLDRAASLVVHSNFSMKEIAAMFGFTDQFHLSKRFKQAYGLAPAHLRTLAEKGETPPLARLVR